MEALKAVTINAAWQIAQDDKIGSIEKGKVADLVVLDSNPLAEQADVAIKDIKVYATYAEGREIFKR
jgi:imidazolonepropionase-like amidohydrolase